MKIKFIHVFAVLVLATGVYVYLLNKKLANQNEDLVSMIEIGVDRNKELLEKNMTLKAYAAKHLSTQYSQLDESISLKELDGTEQSLKELISRSGEMLVFRLSQSECLDCNLKISHVLDSLYSSGSTVKRKMMVISDYESEEFFSQDFPEIKVPVFFRQRLDLPMDGLNKSYFFILDSGYTVTDSHMFDIEDIDLIRLYLKKRVLSS